jgi:ABC-type glycerol-3-phosphate transport system substrate-binding protein
MKSIWPYLVLVGCLGFFFATERLDLFRLTQGDHRTVVSFWAFAIPARTMEDLKGEFEIRHPDIRIEVQTVAWESMQEKVLWAIAANANVPDVIVGSSEWSGGLVQSGGLLPLDGGGGFDAGFYDAFYPNALECYRFPEIDRNRPGWRGSPRQYGIPLDLDLMMIFYRADLLDPVMAEAGFEAMPGDWAGFERLAAEVRARAPKDTRQRHLLYLDPDDAVPLGMAFLPASGATFLNPDYTAATFNSPEGVAAFEFFGRLLRSSDALRWERKTMEDPLVLYKTDRVMANIAGPWYTKYLEQRSPEQGGKWRAALFPRRTPDEPSCGLGGACLSVPYNAPHPKEALELIRFMSTNHFAIEYSRRVASPPPQKSAWDAPEFSRPIPYFGGQKVYEVVRQALETAKPLQLMPSPEITKGPVKRAMRQISEGDAPAQQVLDKEAADADRILRSL